MANSIKLDLEVFYEKYDSFEASPELDRELVSIIHRAVSWYGPIGISVFGEKLSSQTVRMLAKPMFDQRFRNLYYHLMLQNRSNFNAKDIEFLKRLIEVHVNSQ